MPVHIAVIRHVRAGKESEFQERLRKFMHESFVHGGVLGASPIMPPEGSHSREFGILRTFANDKEREAFYASPLFKAWNDSVGDLTEGEPEYRELHWLEAWFRSPGAPPPRWKMGVATLLGVYPTSLMLNTALGPALRGLPMLASALIFSICMVALLTWAVMPAITHVLRSWIAQ